MIQTIEDARRRRESVKLVAALVDRLARRYWPNDEGDAGGSGSKTFAEIINRDEIFRHLEAVDLQQHAQRVLADLDDLSVLLIFSVFEAQVRGTALAELERLLPHLPEHPVLGKAFEEAKKRINDGSFGHLTESYGTNDPDLRTQVDQVRRFRNWVAHGRRDQPAQNVTPETAADRLGRFLKLLESSPPPA
ncbi:hypothetical protein [Paludisphaera sp.]|uniref:hypothetical protein n=1 Tax=Paludisphaera sp. TaxID=2017432 RepID=UPI00301CBBD1